MSITSIVTPLGLYDVVKPASSQTNAPFGYIRDPSAFGYGTPPRSDAPFTRVCGDIACPGTVAEQNCTKMGLGEVCSSVYDALIPDDLKGIFRDGPSSFSDSVSSIFDIQWRSYRNSTGYIVGSYLVPFFRQLSFLILDESIKAYEGLIVDMKEGGIGFRSHTAPIESFDYGSTWSEDLLFVEPETQCVNLNLTLDFELPRDGGKGKKYMVHLNLTDRGGFSALARTSPVYDSLPNGQDLNLRERAYKAAWLNNFYTMVYFNVTGPDRSNITRVDSKENATYPITNRTGTNFEVSQDIIRSNVAFGQYLNLNISQRATNGSHILTNPFNITSDYFSFVCEYLSYTANPSLHMTLINIASSCIGTSFYSPANINSTIVGCSLLYGAGQRTDGGQPLIFDPGSSWSVPIYSCATSVKATVRTASFVYNGTGLDSLTINNTQPKSYPDTSSLPLWGVEDMQSPRTISYSPPLWGIVGRANTTLPSTPYNLSTTAKESLYLPGFQGDTYLLVNGMDSLPMTKQNLPGVEFYAQALFTTTSITRPGISTWNNYADYSGQTSLALFAKWQQLSASAAGAGRILDLIWTDVAANAVLGTKGWGLTSVAASASTAPKSTKREVGPAGSDHVKVPIVVYEKYIRYRLPFAVPAFVVLSLTTAVLCALIILCVTGRTGPKRMRRLLEDTSVGRTLGVLLWPEKKKGLGTGEWTEAVGTRNVMIGREGITKEEESLVDGKEPRDGDWTEGGETKNTASVSESREVGARDEHEA